MLEALAKYPDIKSIIGGVYTTMTPADVIADTCVQCIGIGEGEEVIIQGTTPDGKVHVLARLTAESPVVGRIFNIDPIIGRTLTISAVDANTGTRWI